MRIINPFQNQNLTTCGEIRSANKGSPRFMEPEIS
jgi:hypothetical protein